MRTRSRSRLLLAAALLTGSVFPGAALSAQETVSSAAVGVVAAPLPLGDSGVAVPLTARDVFVGVAEANTGASLGFVAAHGDIGALLDATRAYYVEVLTGSLEGERLDVDVAGTIAVHGSTVRLSLGAGSHSTRSTLADGALTGARCALRPHVRLVDLQSMFGPGLTGHNVPGRADGVWLFENGEFRFYHPKADNATWVRSGSNTDFRRKVVPPDTSVLVRLRSGSKWFVNAGTVRANDFRRNLAAGLQPFATGFPIDLTPTDVRAFVDPSTPVANRWTGSALPSEADEIRLVSTTSSEVRLYLDADGTTWRTESDPTNLADMLVLRALGMVVVKRKNPDPSYRIAAPF